MLQRKCLTLVGRCIRRSSQVAIRENVPSKFAVVNGKFVRVPLKDGEVVTEEITHTGQYFEDGDWKKNRFHDRTKLVNQNWAVKLIAELPPVEVDGRVAVCDGRDGPDSPAALGHPRVYINLDKGDVESCLYCGNRFIQKPHH